MTLLSKSVDFLKLSSLIELFGDFKISVISPLIVHSFDVAKFSTAIYDRIKGDANSMYMYLSGFFHDIGLVVYSQVSAPGSVGVALKEDFNGNLGFDIVKFLERFDSGMIHPRISKSIVEKFELLPPEFKKAILNHHTPLEKLDGTDYEILLSNILNVADAISQLIRRSIRWGMENIRRVFDEITEMERMMLPEVRSAVKDLFEDLVVVRYCIDEEPFHEIFMGADVRLTSKQFLEMLKMITLFIDLRSPFTLKHSSSIATLARDIAKEMFGSEFDGMMMYMAGLVHDLGKLRTPIYILHKPGKLDPREMYVMKLHVVDTFKMLGEYEELSEITAVASLHHERLDGSGYPWGYSEKDLGIRARILQVADVFEALLEERPYRKAFTKEEALKVVEDEVNRGGLDAGVFETLKTMIENGYEIQREDMVIFEFFKDLEDIDRIRELISKVTKRTA